MAGYDCYKFETQQNIINAPRNIGFVIVQEFFEASYQFNFHISVISAFWLESSRNHIRCITSMWGKLRSMCNYLGRSSLHKRLVWRGRDTFKVSITWANLLFPTRNDRAWLAKECVRQSLVFGHATWKCHLS